MPLGSSQGECACTLTLTVRGRLRAREELWILKSVHSRLRNPSGAQVYGDRGSPTPRPAGKSRTGPEAPCVCCGEWGPIMARGLHEVCYRRWRGRGQLRRWPLIRRHGTYRLERGFAIARAMEYADLRQGTGALSRKRACIVLNITERTAYRYEAWLRDKALNGDTE